MAFDICAINKATQLQLNSLGVVTADLQKKLDAFAKQANKSLDLMDIPIVKNLVQNFNNALSSTVSGAVGTLSASLAAKIGQNVTIVSAILSLVLMVSSMGSQMQALLASQLKREVAIRITIFRLLLWHYQNVQTILNLLQYPRSISYEKVLAVLPYVKKAEGLFQKVIIAQGTGDLPARYSYPALHSAFVNLQIAVNILTSDASAGGVALGNALEQKFGGTATPKQTTQKLAQKLAGDLVFASVAKSLSYIETLTWNYMHIASMLPTPYEVGNTIFKPSNSLDAYLRSNGATSTGVQVFNKGKADAARSDLMGTYMAQTNSKLVNSIAEIDIQKGLVPTNVIIDSLITAIIDFPNINLDLQGATSTLVSFLIPLGDSVSNVRQGMQDAIANKDPDLVLTGKEAVWTSTLNTILGLRNGALATVGTTAQVSQDVYTLKALVDYLTENQGSYVIAENMPKFIVQSLSVLGAPFSARSLQESQILATFLIKQLKGAINQDQLLLNKCVAVGEPLSQFTGLLDVASKMPAPVSTIANALKTGQISQVSGFVTAITLGTYDSIKKLFGSECSELNGTEDIALTDFDTLNDEIDTFYGTGTGQQSTVSGFPTA
jgi:hypothetical protein